MRTKMAAALVRASGGIGPPTPARSSYFSSRCSSLSPLTAISNASSHAYAFAGRQPVPAPDPTFFDDVVDAIIDKYGWDPDAEVRVWPLDTEGALVDAVQCYEFPARMGPRGRAGVGLRRGRRLEPPRRPRGGGGGRARQSRLRDRRWRPGVRLRR
ncbi:uncharacterized protein LOC125520164 [Triticum urartu]|uniref:Uncharacterized protein n=1 Tax=Triticum urartu TaxID=4572 RepID=A0A8R7VA99_TRIUA|nr:uncharacterized protein LOC125520164 [Triticum urartu]XP_048540959.1 uncharacterized protein LOC125520164 [Triticum urartu]